MKQTNSLKDANYQSSLEKEQKTRIKEIGFVVKNISIYGKAEARGLHSKFYQTLKGERVPVPHKLFWKTESDFS